MEKQGGVVPFPILRLGCQCLHATMSFSKAFRTMETLGCPDCSGGPRSSEYQHGAPEAHSIDEQRDSNRVLNWSSGRGGSRVVHWLRRRWKDCWKQVRNSSVTLVSGQRWSGWSLFETERTEASALFQKASRNLPWSASTISRLRHFNAQAIGHSTQPTTRQHTPIRVGSCAVV